MPSVFVEQSLQSCSSCDEYGPYAQIVNCKICTSNSCSSMSILRVISHGSRTCTCTWHLAGSPGTPSCWPSHFCNLGRSLCTSVPYPEITILQLLARMMILRCVRATVANSNILLLQIFECSGFPFWLGHL